MIPEPCPIGRWEVGRHVLESRKGNRGRKGIPENDRVLLLDGVKLSFEGYLRGHLEERWPPAVDAAIQDFFFRNEASVFPKALGRAGADLFHRALMIAEDQGLDVAFAYIEYTKG